MALLIKWDTGRNLEKSRWFNPSQSSTENKICGGILQELRRELVDISQ